jgi:membrane protease subunit HflC
VQATRLRAEGEEEFRTITADVDRRVEIISADADRQSSTLRGEGEAQAISILADALGQDPEFFAFLRSLEAYKKILSTQTTVVLPADSPLFHYLQDPQVSLP